MKVIDKTGVRLPCQLDQSVPTDSDAFAEVFCRETLTLQDPACLKLNFAYARLSRNPRSLVDIPLVEYEPLCEGIRIVRIYINYPDTVKGGSRCVDGGKVQTCFEG